jgi:histidyl-tRNA synthetase
MNYADKIKVEKMVIIGANDLAEGNVTVKDMVSGEQEAVEIDNIINYLKEE